MSPKATNRKPTGAELRALRDQRATEGPYAAQEASRRERSFLSRLTGAKEDFDWILSNEAWTHLGFASFTAWYVARVQPTIEALGARPAPELANEVLERIREDEAALPPAQRRTKAELAALTGLSEWKVRGRQDRPNPRNAAVTDLEETSAGTVAPTETEHGAGAPEDSVSGDGDGTSLVAVPTQTSVDQADIDGRVSVRTQEQRTDEPGEVASSASPGPQAPVAQVAMQPDDPDAGSEESGEDLPSSPDSRLDLFRSDMLVAKEAFMQWDAETIAELGPDAFDLYIDISDYIAAHRIEVLREQPVVDPDSPESPTPPGSPSPAVGVAAADGEVPAPAVMGAGTDEGGQA